MNVFIFLSSLTTAAMALTPIPPKKDETFFPASRNEIEQILGSKVFSGHLDHTVTSIRRGEIGESAAYFVRLEKPFSHERRLLLYLSESRKNMGTDEEFSRKMLVRKSVFM